MKKKTLISLTIIIGLAVLFVIVANYKSSPVTLGSDGIFIIKSIDDKIKEAELIIIGEVVTTLPSRWNAPDGKISKNPSPEEVSRAHGLFTDSLISINQLLKGDFTEPVVRVRSFIGETPRVRWINDSETSFIHKQTYLLFLEKDTGATAKVDPGDYVSVNANMAVYEIVDGKAISADDEWILEELIVYIEKSLSGEVPLPTPAPAEMITETPLTLTNLPTEILFPVATEILTETPLPSIELATETPIPADASTSAP